MTATVIYHILTNSFIGMNFKTTNESIELFKERLFEPDCHETEVYKILHEPYKTFLHRFHTMYGTFFAKKKKSEK